MPPRPAFGYMRIDHLVSDAEREALQRRLRSFAEMENYSLEQIFIEVSDVTSSAYAALIDAAHCAGITTILVPSLDHLGRLASLRAAMIQHIEAETGAHVVAVQAV
jgi:DNA invertase Pin-like site-specific DNA recombinase